MASNKVVSLAFTADTPRRKKVNLLAHDEDEIKNDSKQQIISFSGEERNVQAEGARENRSIHPLPNTFRNGRRYVPSYLPEKLDDQEIRSKGIDKFETVKMEDSEGDAANITYGLIKREQVSVDGMSQQERDTVAFKEDLRHLPPESCLEEYEKMPVEAFGEALMRGMGWFEGRGIGRNAKGEVEAKELVRRTDKLGLGADPTVPKKTEKRFIKPGETRERNDLVYIDNAGAIRSSRPVDASLTKRGDLGVIVGKKMYLKSGKHSGFECEVKFLDEAKERASVRLLPSLETITVGYKDLVDITQKRQSETSIKQPSNVKKVRISGSRDVKPWLFPNIRVKVVDKKAFDGRLYLKKGTILDVKAPKVCDIYIDDFAEIFQDLDQNQIETYVPRQVGATILIVAGKFKGRQGQLLHRSKQSDYVAVKVNDEDDVQKLHLNDIAEYRCPNTS